MSILAYHEAKIDTRKRNLAGFILFFLSTLLLIVEDLATSGHGGIGPYLGICAFVACFGVADALVQGGMVGDLAFTCPEFMQSFFAGLAASGAVTSGLRLLTKAAFENASSGLRKGAKTVSADLAALVLKQKKWMARIKNVSPLSNYFSRISTMVLIYFSRISTRIQENMDFNCCFFN